MSKTGCRYGTHRVLNPHNALPQNAQALNNGLPLFDNELLIDVDTLNIDSASFHQILDATQGNETAIKDMIMSIVAERGKMQNPVTGSGGMLLGTVKEIGPKYPNTEKLSRGDRIATLVSLSLTPLHLKSIDHIYKNQDQVKVTGHAILFESGILAKIPNDIPEKLALAILDVAGAPAQTQRLVQPGYVVVIIGAGGKSGTLCGAMARDILKESGQLIAIEPSPRGLERLNQLGHYDSILNCDARNPLECQQAVAEVTRGRMADLVINCASVADTEMSSILTAKNSGTVYFFTMTTSFTKAALGAEGVGSDAKLIIGNGYAPHHAKISLDLVRQHPEVRKLFEEFYI